jgi:DNA topoisomerase-1
VLDEFGPAASEREANRNVVTAMRLVASELGNTPAICRASYVHPIVVERYVEEGVTIGVPKRNGNGAPSPMGHTPEERALIAFLRKYFPERRRKRRVDES